MALLAELVDRSGRSQRDIERGIGVGHGWLRHLFRGEIDLKVQHILRLGKFLGVQTNNFAEYTGLLLGLRRAKEMGVQEVEVFADSELMIRQLGGRYQVKSESLR